MKSRQFISIVLCTFNGERYLEPQLNSIFKQSKAPDEIIISDDNSSDSTKTILERLKNSEKDSIFLYENQSNLGYKKNFAKAISYSRGNIIFFSDQDDVWQENKIELLSIFMEQNPEIQCAETNILLTYEGSKTTKRMFSLREQKRFNKSKKQTEKLLKRPMFPGTGMAIQKSLIDKYPTIPDGFLHDEFYSLTASISNSCRFVPQTTTFYRQHSGQAIGAASSLSKKISKKHDFDLEMIKYQNFLFLYRSIVPKKIADLLQERIFFLSCRKKIHNMKPIKALFYLFCHPGTVSQYLKNSEKPTKSMLKDALIK